jgi:hypothetical protein
MEIKDLKGVEIKGEKKSVKVVAVTEKTISVMKS